MVLGSFDASSLSGLRRDDLSKLGQPIGTFLDEYSPRWKEVPTLKQSSKLNDAFEAFSQHSVSTLFVVDGSGVVIGKFSLADLFFIISHFDSGVDA